MKCDKEKDHYPEFIAKDLEMGIRASAGIMISSGFTLLLLLVIGLISGNPETAGLIISTCLLVFGFFTLRIADKALYVKKRGKIKKSSKKTT